MGWKRGWKLRFFGRWGAEVEGNRLGWRCNVAFSDDDRVSGTYSPTDLIWNVELADLIAYGGRLRLAIAKRRIHPRGHFDALNREPAVRDRDFD